MLTSLTRELVFGVERAGECAISLWDEREDMLVDAAAWTMQGPPAWPRGQEMNALARLPGDPRAAAAAGAATASSG